LKNSAHRWLWFSQLVIPVEKMIEFIVLHPVSEKYLSRLFKIPSGLPVNSLGKQVVKLCKKWFFDFWGRWFLEGMVVARTPPRVVSGIRVEGLIAPGDDKSPGENHFLETPLIKVRMVTSGLEKFTNAD